MPLLCHPSWNGKEEIRPGLYWACSDRRIVRSLSDFLLTVLAEQTRCRLSWAEMPESSFHLGEKEDEMWKMRIRVYLEVSMKWILKGNKKGFYLPLRYQQTNWGGGMQLLWMNQGDTGSRGAFCPPVLLLIAGIFIWRFLFNRLAQM